MNNVNSEHILEDSTAKLVCCATERCVLALAKSHTHSQWGGRAQWHNKPITNIAAHTHTSIHTRMHLQRNEAHIRYSCSSRCAPGLLQPCLACCSMLVCLCVCVTDGNTAATTATTMPEQQQRGIRAKNRSKLQTTHAKCYREPTRRDENGLHRPGCGLAEPSNFNPRPKLKQILFRPSPSTIRRRRRRRRQTESGYGQTYGIIEAEANRHRANRPQSTTSKHTHTRTKTDTHIYICAGKLLLYLH